MKKSLFEEDKLIGNLVAQEYQKSNQFRESIWEYVSNILEKPSEEIKERYLNHIQYDPSFKKKYGLPSIALSYSPINAKKRKSQVEDIEEFEETPKKQKKVEEILSQETPKSVGKKDKTPKSAKKVSTEEKEDLEEDLREKEKKLKVKKVFETISKETGKSKKEILHALYFNSGNLLNTIKCFNTPCKKFDFFSNKF